MRKLPRHILSPSSRLVVLVLLCSHQIGWSQVNVLQNRNDPGASGANLNEVTLTPSNVNASGFGRLFSYPVDGEVVAQPLYVSNVFIPGQGTRNVLYVATMRNVVYAFDADNPVAGSGGKLWEADLNQTASGAIPFKATDVTGTHSENYPVNIGILSTPIIDLGRWNNLRRLGDPGERCEGHAVACSQHSYGYAAAGKPGGDPSHLPSRQRRANVQSAGAQSACGARVCRSKSHCELLFSRRHHPVSRLGDGV